MNGNYKSIATKVSSNAFAMLTAICGSMRKTVYDLMQSVASFIIHTFDKPHGLTEQEEVMKREWMEIANNELYITDPDAEVECSEATFYMCDKTGKKTGVFGALIKRPFFGRSEITYNHRTIIERSFCLLYPRTYKQLRVIGAAIGSTSVLETILMLMVKAEDGINTTEIHEEFGDNERSDWGKKMADQPYRRKMHRSIDSEFDFGGTDEGPSGG